MRFLPSLDPARQQRFVHRGRIYSVVDLTIAPIEANGHRASAYLDSHFEELMIEHYGDYHFELADVTNGGVEVIDRYLSFKDAIHAIKFGYLGTHE